MSKHTPGPWKIGTPPPNGEQTIGTLGGLMVAVATTGCGMPTLANARLIEQAPELRRVLKALLDSLDANGSCMYESLRDEGRAVIARTDTPAPQEPYNCAERGHVPIGWTGTVYCEVCGDVIGTDEVPADGS